VSASITNYGYIFYYSQITVQKKIGNWHSGDNKSKSWPMVDPASGQPFADMGADWRAGLDCYRWKNKH
jgi:hypothetical protein